MTNLKYAAGAALLLLATACDRSTTGAIAGLPAVPREPVPVNLLRIPRAGGLPRLYRIPSLDTLGWHAADQVPPVRQVLGADPEQGLVYALDRAGTLIALDLDTRRVRSQLRQVRAATVGPDGAVYAVDPNRGVTQLVRRAPVRFRSKLQGEPRELHATMNGVLVARVGGEPAALEVLGSDRPPTAIPIPDGAIAATALGDLIAVAADTAVVLYSAAPKQKSWSIRMSEGAQAVAFSPSGHLLYVVGGEHRLTVIDRFGREVLTHIDLPGQARDLRPDAQGRWLLVQPETGDSVWVIDVSTRRFVGAVAAPWSRDLPLVAAPNTLLIRREADLIALDLAGPQFPETGRVEAGANDFWLPLPWHPAREAPTPAVPADTIEVAAEPGDSAVASAKVYLQLSSSQNPTWAEDLASKLRAAEFPASVLPPEQPDEAYRVVLGPYPTREQAEEAGRGLGMPSFVITIPGQ